MVRLSQATVADIEMEQRHVTLLYARLDALRDRAERHLSELLRESGGTPQARSQRDSTVGSYAAEVLATIDPAIEPPRAVRRTGVEPRDLAGGWDLLASVVAEEIERAGDGRLAVIAPAVRVPDVARFLSRSAVATSPDGTARDPSSPDLSERAVLLSVVQAKGLEFDGVVVVDPDGILAGSPRGSSDLYVTLTRTTQRLTVFRPSAEDSS